VVAQKGAGLATIAALLSPAFVPLVGCQPQICSRSRSPF